MVKVYKGNLWLKHMWARNKYCSFYLLLISNMVHFSCCSFQFLLILFFNVPISALFRILLIPKMVHSKSCLFQILLIPNLQSLLIPNLAHSKSYSFQIYDLTALKCAAQGFTLLISYILDLNGSYSCLQIFFQLHSSS